MSDTKFTPGPWGVWTVGGKLTVTDNANVNHLAYVVKEQPTALANAHLIAAAPDMFAALEDMLSGWDYIRMEHGDLPGVGWDRCEDAARAALAKARGQA